MNFNKHSDLEGKHAFLSPSNYHWINYDRDKLEKVYFGTQAIKWGTEMHALAAKLIHTGTRLPKVKSTFNAYVNDAIGYRMKPEQVLYYSDNCFGTADAISFRNNFLRIHDLKTGATPASMHQLEIYAAIFCLEYSIDPSTIKMELRIYQADEVSVYSPEPNDIAGIMKTIAEFDKYIEGWKDAHES